MSPNLLHRLRDVRGVTGSFACTATGSVLLSDLPGTESGALDRAASNVLSLLEIGRDSMRDCNRLSCRFETHRLEVLALNFGFLCVVTESERDKRLLDTAMRMVARRFLQR
jgi:hypothetical protein